MKARLSATFVVLAVGFALRVAHAAPPVPLYPSHVIKIVKIGPGQAVVVTKDSVATVCAWYRKNLHESTGETTRQDGTHFFHTKSGAGVAVEAGNRFEPGTKISLVWDAKKYGGF